MKSLRLALLFFSAFGIRCLVWLTDIRKYLGLIEYDGWAYISWGREMFSRICSGDWSGFLVNPIHPPLGKLMIGVFTFLMDPILDPYESAILLMCIISSITSLFVYGIGSILWGRRGGMIAWAAYTFDPFSMHWSMAWLDTPTLLFITVSQYFLLRKTVLGKGCRAFLPSAFLYGLALMTKFHAMLFLPAVLIFLSDWKKRGLFTIISLTVFISNPQLWVSHGVEVVLRENLSVTGKSFQYLSFGSRFPLFILAEIFYRLCVGYVGDGISPFLLPLFLFILITLRKAFFHKLGNVFLLKWVSWSLIGILLTPRLIYPEYYYMYLVVPLSMLLTNILLNGHVEDRSGFLAEFLLRFFLIGSVMAIISLPINPLCWKTLVLALAS